MDKVRINFSFDNDNSKTLEFTLKDGETPNSLLSYITGHSDWFIHDDSDQAINMKLVTRVSVVQRAKIHSRNPF